MFSTFQSKILNDFSFEYVKIFPDILFELIKISSYFNK